MTSSQKPSKGFHRLRHRLFLVILAIVVALLAGEIFLQGASWVAQAWVAQRGGKIEVEGAIRILCVGDSHTFGLPLPVEESYPAQLSEALAARYPALDVEVVNLGVPSLNSAFVANRLEQQMHQMQPQLVIVWVGINNLWNVMEKGPYSKGEGSATWRRVFQSSRLVRLATLIWFTRSGHQYDPGQRGGWWDGESTPSGRLPKGAPRVDPAPGLLRDLTRMASIAYSLETPILFVAYPFSGQQGISRIIMEAGARAGVDVVETAPAMAQARLDGFGRSDLIDERSGPHPSGILYRYVVEAMLPQVEQILSIWHGLPEPSPLLNGPSEKLPSRKG